MAWVFLVMFPQGDVASNSHWARYPHPYITVLHHSKLLAQSDGMLVASVAQIIRKKTRMPTNSYLFLFINLY
jgi:hypothetical protein